MQCPVHSPLLWFDRFVLGKSILIKHFRLILNGWWAFGRKYLFLLDSIVKPVVENKKKRKRIKSEFNPLSLPSISDSKSIPNPLPDYRETTAHSNFTLCFDSSVNLFFCPCHCRCLLAVCIKKWLQARSQVNREMIIWNLLATGWLIRRQSSDELGGIAKATHTPRQSSLVNYRLIPPSFSKHSFSWNFLLFTLVIIKK